MTLIAVLFTWKVIYHKLNPAVHGYPPYKSNYAWETEQLWWYKLNNDKEVEQYTVNSIQLVQIEVGNDVNVYFTGSSIKFFALA